MIRFELIYTRVFTGNITRTTKYTLSHIDAVFSNTYLKVIYILSGQAVTAKVATNRICALITAIRTILVTGAT